jgi:hypothetical protein
VGRNEVIIRIPPFGMTPDEAGIHFERYVFNLSFYGSSDGRMRGGVVKVGHADSD